MNVACYPLSNCSFQHKQCFYIDRWLEILPGQWWMSTHVQTLFLQWQVTGDLNWATAGVNSLGEQCLIILNVDTSVVAKKEKTFPDTKTINKICINDCSREFTGTDRQHGNCVNGGYINGWVQLIVYSSCDTTNTRPPATVSVYP